MNIILIGSGHVASVLGRRMSEQGHRITHLWSRNRANAARLASRLGATLMEADWTAWPEKADLIFVSVSDDAYAQLAAVFPKTSLLLLHSGGAVPDDVFSQVSPHTGVLYPLQSIREETAQMPQLPLLIHTASAGDLPMLKDFAFSLSPLVTEADDETRIRYHVAAVFAANFANHLFALTESYCEKAGLDFAFLRPLLEETVMRMRQYRAADLQTGPAIRADKGTIEKHMLLLKDEPAMKAIYALLTKSIMDFYS